MINDHQVTCSIDGEGGFLRVPEQDTVRKPSAKEIRGRKN